eukprot:5390932-Pyramimonas_sp.AAC.1
MHDGTIPNLRRRHPARPTGCRRCTTTLLPRRQRRGHVRRPTVPTVRTGMGMHERHNNSSYYARTTTRTKADE